MAARKGRGHGGRREGAGRPLDFPDPINRTIRFDRAQAEAGDAIATARGITFAELVRRALSAYLVRRKES